MKFLRIFSLAYFLLFSFSLIHAQTHVLYGMTNLGGTQDEGVIMKFNPLTNRDTVVWNFGAGIDGTSPYSSLAYGPANGLLYGMTYSGGHYLGGTIFSFNPTTKVESVLWNFGGGLDGLNPWGNIIYDAGKGLFYGMTSLGGANDEGIIFSFNPTTHIEAILWSFGSGTDGVSPTGDLTYDAINGMFYAMTRRGGIHDSGTIIRFNPATYQDTVVWNFGSGTDGVSPYGSLVYDTAQGLYYGMTFHGGTHDSGAIISFNPSTNAENVVWNLAIGTDGGLPVGSFIYNANNTLFYGETVSGGANRAGAIITFNPSTNAENVVWSFGSGTDGNSPYGNPVIDPSNGLLYAMTTEGGTSSIGTIFSFNSSTNIENVVWDFGIGPSGNYPFYSSFIVYPPPVVTSGINTINNIPSSINIYPNPTNGILTTTGLDKGQTVELYNYLGQLISSSKTENTTIQTNLSTQADGIYLVRVLNSDGTLASQKKVVKTN